MSAAKSPRRRRTATRNLPDLPVLDRRELERIDHAVQSALNITPGLTCHGVPLRCTQLRLGPGSMTPSARCEWHAHEDMQMEVVLSGCYAFEFEGGGRRILSAGETVIIPPGRLHRWQCRRSGLLLGLLFSSFPDGERTSPGFAACEMTKASVAEDAEVLAHFLHEARRLADGSREASRQALACWIFLVAEKVLRKFDVPDARKAPASGPARNATADFLIRHIDDNISTELRVQQIAEAAGVSTRQVQRVFQSALGMSCHRYVAHRRLAIAHEMIIADARRSLKEIAYACGFSSPANFSTKFSQHYGMCPSEARAAAPQPHRRG